MQVFKFSPLYLLKSSLIFHAQFYSELGKRTLNTAADIFSGDSILIIFAIVAVLVLIPFCKQWTNYIGKINSTNGRMRATRFILKALEG